MSKQKLNISEFLEALKTSGASDTTIKNYKTDIKQFLSWENVRESVNSDATLSTYHDHLLDIYSRASARRKYYAIKKYMSYHGERYKSSPNSISSPAVASRSKLTFGIAGFAIALLLVSVITSSLESNYIDTSPSTDIHKFPSVVVLSNANVEFDEYEGIQIVLGENYRESEPDMSTYSVALANSGLYEDKDYVSTQDNTSALSGVATIPQGKVNTIISHPSITNNTLLFITPTADPDGQQLYIEKQSEGYAIISIENSILRDLTFNWFVNTNKVYKSIL